MLIHRIVAATDEIRTSARRTANRRATHSLARRVAETIWRATWHTGAHVIRERRRRRLAESIHRERQVLARLSEDQLKDIGITRAEALREASRDWGDIPRSRQDSNDW